jgi:hypothetical protein
MRYLPALLPALFLMLSGPLTGQAYAQLGGGLSGVFGGADRGGSSIRGAIGYHHSLSERYGLYLGFGLARQRFSSETESFLQGQVISEPPVPYRGVSSYRVRSTDLQVRLGLARKLGPFSIQVSLLPSYLLKSRMESDFTYYSRGGIPTGEIDFVDVPFREERPQNFVGTYHKYDSPFSLDGSLGGYIAVGAHWRIGLEYQDVILGREVFESTEFDCPPDQFCIAIGTYTRDVPVSNGTLTVQATYIW